MKLVQGMYASLLPVSTEIRLVQGMTTLGLLWSPCDILYTRRSLDESTRKQQGGSAHRRQGAFTRAPDHCPC